MIINKIRIDSQEVLHYPWLDYTKICIIVNINEDADECLNCFNTILNVLLYSGIKKTCDFIIKECNIYKNDFSLNISFCFNELSYSEIVKKYIISASDWVLNTNIKFSDKLKEHEIIFNNNRSMIISFFKDLKEKIETNDFVCHFESVDGMD